MHEENMIAEKISAYLQKQDWTFEDDSLNGRFSLEAELTCKLNFAQVEFQVVEDGFICYTSVPDAAEDSVKASVGEYLHRANYGLPRGCFEFNYDDGDIHFKTFFPCGPEGPTDQQLQDSMTIGLSVVDLYGDGIYELLHSPSPASRLIHAAETEQEG